MPDFELLTPDELNANEWRQLQALSRESFGEQLDRSQTEIDALTAWNDPERYRESRVNPNSEVGRRFNPNQSFSRSRVAVATEGQDFVGFAYGVDNVSGSTRVERFMKMRNSHKRYHLIREIVVQPDYQRSGIATHLGRMVLFSGQPWQSVTAYIWPDEARFMPSVLRKRGFEPTGEQEVHVFGEDAEPVRQVRMQASSAYGVLIDL